MDSFCLCKVINCYAFFAQGKLDFTGGGCEQVGGRERAAGNERVETSGH